MTLWPSSRSSPNIVDLVTSWKTCFVIVWFAAAETSSFNRLLAQQELTFDKAFKMARAMEMVEQEVRDLHQNASQSVHAIHSVDAACTKAPPSSKERAVTLLSLWWEASVHCLQIQDCHLPLLS